MGRKRMAGIDAAWFRLDEPTNRMTVTAVLWLDAPVDWERVKAAIRERLVDRYPPFRRRVVVPRAPLVPLRWEEDRDFDLEAHVRHVRLPGDGCAGLSFAVDRLLSTPLDLSRSPWELLLVEGGDGTCAILAKLHHGLADGVVLARVLLGLTDEHPHAAVEPPPASRHGAAVSVWPRVRAALADPAGLARGFWQVLRGVAAVVRILALPVDARTSLKGRLGVAKRAAWTEPVALAAVKDASGARGATVNDVLLNAVAGALRRELAERGERVAELRAIVPVNLRALDAPLPRELGNRFGLVILPLPVGMADSDRRLAELKRRMDALKRSPEPAATFAVLVAVGLLPVVVERALVLFLGRKATAVMTNVRGPDEPVFLGGARVREIMFWVPQSGRLGLGVSILSYAGQVTIGVAADAGLVPEPQRLVNAVTTELEVVLGHHARRSEASAL